MSGGIVKYFEMDDYGRKLNRVLYALSGNELPNPVDRADWRLDAAFDRGTEILNAPQLKEVFERVLKNGFEIVPEGRVEGDAQMTPAAAIFSRVFALEVDGTPTLAFEAKSTRQAQELCKEPWLRDDLVSLKSNGVPLSRAQSRLSIRTATPEEAVIYEQAAKVAKPSDDILLAYLIELDA
jgi:hypothetical protein